jgi:hypothetical protein|nr:MAG TPA: hypothetical protein [Caudoviricetes sp.]
MIQTGQIIFYDSSKMMCFDVTHFMVKEPEKQMIETTFIGDEERHFIQLTPEPICMFIETGEEIVKLDPTTMKRIARYNLEKENAALLEEIKKHKETIADLEQKEEVLRDRFRKAIATFKEIMENGYYDDGEDEDEDEWE